MSLLGILIPGTSIDQGCWNAANDVESSGEVALDTGADLIKGVSGNVESNVVPPLKNISGGELLREFGAVIDVGREFCHRPATLGTAACCAKKAGTESIL
jgi:hypothetical protein